VTSLPACRGVNALAVKLSVYRIGADLGGCIERQIVVKRT
jgi:hypothetical protein